MWMFFIDFLPTKDILTLGSDIHFQIFTMLIR
jgi:hypothetical protein